MDACFRLLVKHLSRAQLRAWHWVLWWAKPHMCHRLMFPWDSQMQKQIQYPLQMPYLHNCTIIMAQGSGLREFVLVSMICRAVRYFLPCDLDLSEAKKWMKGALLSSARKDVTRILCFFYSSLLEVLSYKFML